MWLLPLHHFIGLSKMKPHQELLREGKLARFDSSMKAIFFLSHQWTSFDHPDPTGEQLRCMQRQVLKMLEGSAANVEVGFSDRTYLPGGASVSGAEWKRLLNAGHVFVWLDYSSVPVRRGITLCAPFYALRKPPVSSNLPIKYKLTRSCAARRLHAANWGIQRRSRRRFGRPNESSQLYSGKLLPHLHCSLHSEGSHL